MDEQQPTGCFVAPALPRARNHAAVHFKTRRRPAWQWRQTDPINARCAGLSAIGRCSCDCSTLCLRAAMKPVFSITASRMNRGDTFSRSRRKSFPTITGDGIRTVEELIRADSRAALMARIYLRRFASRRNEILPPGEILKLVETGNHAQGCIFRDGMHLWTEALERVIDEISQKLPGFFIGRYDIRYENEKISSMGAISRSSSSTALLRRPPAFMIRGTRSSRRIARYFANGDWSSRLERSIGRTAMRLASLATLWRNWRQYSAAALSYPLAG